MKKFLVLLLLLNLLSPAIANNRYKGYYFSDIMTDVYKRGGYYFVRHNDSPNVFTVVNNNLNFHQGAINACADIGMRLPSKDEVAIVFDYLSNIVNYNQNIEFWLNDNAAGAKTKYTKVPANSNDYAYIFWYYGGNITNRSYDLSVHRKDSNSSSNVIAICIQDAPPMTNNDRINLIKEDYSNYVEYNKYITSIYDGTHVYSGNYKIREQEQLIEMRGKRAFYTSIKNLYDNCPPSIFYMVNRKYLKLILTNLEKISKSSGNINLGNYEIVIKDSDNKKLNDDVKRAINQFNNLLVYDDKKN